MLENEDQVLAKGGENRWTRSKITSVLSPFLERNKEFAKKTGLTYKIAKVRIYVECFMQRLKTHGVLHKISEHLLERVDNISHICCVLVNFQPLILSFNNSENQTTENFWIDM